MTTPNEIHTLEPTVLAAAWRYRWIVLAAAALFGVVAFLYASQSGEKYEATASIVVEDPRSGSIFNTRVPQRPSDYVIDQIQILQSAEVARRAADIINADQVDAGITTARILRQSSVAAAGEDSTLIRVTVTMTVPGLPVATANAMAQAYEDLLQSEAQSAFASSVQVLDERILELEQQATEIAAEIDDAQQDPEQELPALSDEFQASVERLRELQSQLLAAPLTARDAIRVEIGDLLLVLQGVSQAANLAAAADGTDLADLQLRQSQLLARINDLEVRRDSLVLDGQLLGTGVTLTTPAVQPRVVSNANQLLVIAILLGLMAGTALAYVLANRRRTFEDRGQPELVLGAPLLAEVPVFKQEGLRSAIPVRAAPRSASAESFRFAATGLYSPRVSPNGEVAEGRSLVVTSAKVGEGKTVVAVNTALAVTMEGKRVLLIDADFGNQMASEFLAPGVRPTIGLTEVVEEGVPLTEAVIPIEVGSSSLHLLARGWRRNTAPEFFRLPEMRAFMEQVIDAYDLVVIDAPPLLQVAYTSTIASLADGVVVVVPHRGNVSDLEEVQDRLLLLGTPPVGYVYNLAPLRPDMFFTEGSMKDVLGGLIDDEQQEVP